MEAMHGDAPPPPSAAARLTGPLAEADEAVNALHDRLNEAAPGLWWPLRAPAADRRLGRPEHALYATHAGLGLAVAAALAPRRLRVPVAVATAVLGAASWAIFTGAWDRRADQAASAARRSR